MGAFDQRFVRTADGDYEGSGFDRTRFDALEPQALRTVNRRIVGRQVMEQQTSLAGMRTVTRSKRLQKKTVPDAQARCVLPHPLAGIACGHFVRRDRDAAPACRRDELLVEDVAAGTKIARGRMHDLDPPWGTRQRRFA